MNERVSAIPLSRDVERAIEHDTRRMRRYRRLLLPTVAAMVPSAYLGQFAVGVVGAAAFVLGYGAYTLRRMTRAASNSEWVETNARFISARSTSDRIYYILAETGVEGILVRDALPNLISPQNGKVFIPLRGPVQLVVVPGNTRLQRVQKFHLKESRRNALTA